MARPRRESSEKTALLSERLKKLKEEKQKDFQMRNSRILTDTEMAAELQIAQSSFSNFIHDVQTPGADSISKLALYFDVSADYLVGNSTVRSRDLEVQDICKKTKLTENALKVLQTNAYAPILINSILESKELNDLSRSFKRLLVSAGIYMEDGIQYGYLEKPTSFPILADEEDEDNITLREKMEEQNMDMVKFCEYLVRDTFDVFTESIVKNAEHTSPKA